ncbi:MAG: hypothetical protein V1906_03475 [Candidatus Woesearchaeota archaeon]
MKLAFFVFVLVLMAGIASAQDVSMYIQLGYDGNNVSVSDAGLADGVGANIDYTSKEYFAVVKSLSGKSSSADFYFPRIIFLDSIAGGPSTIATEDSSVLLYFPYYRDVDRLEVYDSNRRLVLAYGLSDFRVCDFDGRCVGGEDLASCPEDCRTKVVRPTEELKQEAAAKLSEEEPTPAAETSKGFYVLIIGIILLALIAFMTVKFQKKSKGQISLFIILGIVIVFAIGMGMYFSGSISSMQKQQESVKAESALAQSEEVRNYVEACIADTANYIVPIVLRNGGYYVLHGKKVSYQYYEVPIYMDDGKESVPTLDLLKRQIAAGIDAELPKCLGGISDNAEISGISESQVKINTGKITIETNLPLTVKGEVTSKLVGFYVEVPATILPVYNEAKSLYEEMKIIKGIVPISKLAFLAEKKDYKFVSDNVGDVQVYILRFDQYMVNNVPLEYSFAVSNPLKEGERIMLDGVDYSEMFGLVPEEASEEGSS